MIKNILSGVNSFVNRLAFAIVLILIFAIFIYPLFSGGKEVKRVENQMEKIGTALESYYAEKGSWPSSGPSNIGVILKDSVSQKRSWGKEYRYFFFPMMGMQFNRVVLIRFLQRDKNLVRMTIGIQSP